MFDNICSVWYHDCTKLQDERVACKSNFSISKGSDAYAETSEVLGKEISTSVYETLALMIRLFMLILMLGRKK